MLCRLTYFSERSFACPDTEVAGIVQSAAQRNRARNVTGFLISDQRYFLQVLEGDRATLSALFDTIQADLRHSDVVLAAFEEIQTPHFPDWGMAQVGDVDAIKLAAGPIIGGAPLNPALLTASELRRLVFDASSAARLHAA